MVPPFQRFPVALPEGPHPISSRTRKLSPPGPMVLQSYLCGRVGRRRILFQTRSRKLGRVFLCPFSGPSRAVEPGGVHAAGTCVAFATSPSRRASSPRLAHGVGARTLPPPLRAAPRTADQRRGLLTRLSMARFEPRRAKQAAHLPRTGRSLSAPPPRLARARRKSPRRCHPPGRQGRRGHVQRAVAGRLRPAGHRQRRVAKAARHRARP